MVLSRGNGWLLSGGLQFDDPGVRFYGVIAELTHRLDRAPNASELANELGIARDDLIDYLTLNGSVPGHDDFEPSAAREVCVDDLETILIQRFGMEGLRPQLGSLTGAERAAVVMRLVGPFKCADIAARIGVSPREVSRLLASALSQLRDVTGSQSI